MSEYHSRFDTTLLRPDGTGIVCRRLDDTAMPLVEFVKTLVHEIENKIYDADRECLIHPSGACIIGEYFAELREAACRGDHAEVTLLSHLARKKAAQELVWASGDNRWIKGVTPDGQPIFKEEATA